MSAHLGAGASTRSLTAGSFLPCLEMLRWHAAQCNPPRPKMLVIGTSHSFVMHTCTFCPGTTTEVIGGVTPTARCQAQIKTKRHQGRKSNERRREIISLDSCIRHRVAQIPTGAAVGCPKKKFLSQIARVSTESTATAQLVGRLVGAAGEEHGEQRRAAAASCSFPRRH